MSLEFIGGPCCGDHAPPSVLELDEGECFYLPEVTDSILSTLLQTPSKMDPLVIHIYRRDGDLMVYQGVKKD
tara:strand:+ start:316 stop:531 length:216 start_codon:yes stop_codon:yes gene_type:complete